MLILLSAWSDNQSIQIGEWYNNKYSNPLLEKQITIPKSFRIVSFYNLQQNILSKNGGKVSTEELKTFYQDLSKFEILELFQVTKPILTYENSNLLCSIVKSPYNEGKIHPAFLLSNTNATKILKKQTITKFGTAVESYYIKNHVVDEFRYSLIYPVNNFMFLFDVSAPSEQSLKQYVKILEDNFHN